MRYRLKRRGRAIGNFRAIVVAAAARGFPTSLAWAEAPVELTTGGWKQSKVSFDAGVVNVEVNAVLVLVDEPINDWVSGESYWFGFGGAGTGHSIRNLEVKFPSLRCL